MRGGLCPAFRQAVRLIQHNRSSPIPEMLIFKSLMRSPYQAAAGSLAAWDACWHRQGCSTGLNPEQLTSFASIY